MPDVPDEMTWVEFRAARRRLGYSQQEMAKALGLGTPGGRRTVQRIEAGAPITGPMALAVRKLLDDQR